MKQVTMMNLKRETKGAVLYENPRSGRPGEMITNIYLRKDGIEGEIPPVIFLHIRTGEEEE